MKPFKSGKEIATWMQRIALLPLLFQLYFNSVSALNFGNISFYLGICMLICGILIIIGGIFSKPGYTIICSLILFCVSIYKCIRSFNGTFDNYMAMHLIVIALGLFFFYQWKRIINIPHVFFAVVIVGELKSFNFDKAKSILEKYLL